MKETELKELEMPLITDDAVVLGLLVSCLALILHLQPKIAQRVLQVCSCSIIVLSTPLFT